MPLYDYECKDCGEIWEEIRKVDQVLGTACPICLSREVKQLITLTRKPIKFPDGIFHGLPDEPFITSRRQLREEVKKAGKDEFTECYSKYIDGYGGY